tara:strand:- start:508 stop:777 length:270 start_codon:yes stop_codon:yes gene_type:complete
MPDDEIEEQQEKDKVTKDSVTLTGAELLRLIIFFPVVMVWLVLACRIIWSATSSKETLDSIEGLLTALAVLTIPVSAGLNELWKGSKDK